MVIYEVNLIIQEEVYSQFQSWLKDHARAMLQFPGFLHAHILKPENEDVQTQKKLTVQYHIDNRDSLTNYLNQFAEKMRKEGLKHFKDKFSAERRIYEEHESILK